MADSVLQLARRSTPPFACRLSPTIQGVLKQLHEHRQRDIEGPAKRAEFGNIDSALSALTLANKGLRLLKTASKLDLGQASISSYSFEHAEKRRIVAR